MTIRLTTAVIACACLGSLAAWVGWARPPVVWPPEAHELFVIPYYDHEPEPGKLGRPVRDVMYDPEYPWTQTVTGSFLIVDDTSGMVKEFSADGSLVRELPALAEAWYRLATEDPERFDGLVGAPGSAARLVATWAGRSAEARPGRPIAGPESDPTARGSSTTRERQPGFGELLLRQAGSIAETPDGMILVGEAPQGGVPLILDPEGKPCLDAYDQNGDLVRRGWGTRVCDAAVGCAREALGPDGRSMEVGVGGVIARSDGSVMLVLLAYDPEGVRDQRVLWAPIGAGLGVGPCTPPTPLVGLDGLLYRRSEAGEVTVLSAEGAVIRRFQAPVRLYPARAPSPAGPGVSAPGLTAVDARGRAYLQFREHSDPELTVVDSSDGAVLRSIHLPPTLGNVCPPHACRARDGSAILMLQFMEDGAHVLRVEVQ